MKDFRRTIERLPAQATAECLCREIDPSDVPCLVCACADSLGVLRPANAVSKRGGAAAIRKRLRHEKVSP